MFSLSPKAFFDLVDSPYAPLFSVQYVWEALRLLKEFFTTQRLGVLEGVISNQAYLVHPEQISIGKGSVVEPGAYIQGPCIIGKNCQVRKGAYLRGHVLAADGCVMGCEIKHSILLNKAAAAHYSYVGDSILGQAVNLGAGVKCANLRLDRQPIVIRFQNEAHETGLKKMGVIAADGVQLGCNVVTNPGTLIGKKTLCYPSLNIGGVIAENKILRPTHSSYVAD
jgi:UDP-N-acetylglucosamine diphosphorylase / glucose-1-phosphate thymidylyltransferase / UDP-N-acetylgalactosamine diphosphorylase / glucosamine-1-phosphate N-acetyltransferase / galactosamine-1-phosphate N-acetyltransferase